MPDPTPDTASVKPMPPVSSRDRILRSAKHLFARKGYENTSTVAIAREAGTSESQLMKHFGSKQGLLGAIFDRGWTNILERAQASPRSTSPVDRLQAVLEAMMIELDNDPDLKELMALEARRVRKDSHEVLMSRGYNQFSELVLSLVEEMRSQGQIRPGVNAQALRSAVIGMTEGLLRDQVVASRSNYPADYNADDIRRVLEIFIPALANEVTPPLKAVNR